MKAWHVRDPNEFYSVIVFAETRGKARAAALYTDALEGSDFISLEVRRLKEADKYYSPGKTELDWDDAADRVVLVRDFGFTCAERFVEHCNICPAKAFCDDYIGDSDKEGIK